MKKVFYSWQSDTNTKENRYFIRKVLKEAEKELNHENVNLEIRIDHDTIGVPGSPDIQKTILDKIESSDFFIADVTIINSESDKKKTPNPNVLFELGYAVSKLGWERIILIMNEKYGVKGKAPFDIAQHRITGYNSERYNELQNKHSLKKDIKTTISQLSSRPLHNLIDLTFTNKKKSLYKKFLYIDPINSDNRERLKKEKEIEIYPASMFKFELSNYSDKTLSDYHLKIWTEDEVEYFSPYDLSPFVDISSGPKEFAFKREDGSIKLPPPERTISPNDTIFFQGIYFRPKLKLGTSHMTINWMILSEHNHDRGELNFKYDLFEENIETLFTSEKYDNKEYLILNKNM